MPVREVLARHTSRELSEWMAYERHAGPIGSGYQDELLAAIHEQLQTLNHLQGAAHFTDKKHRKNPAPEPQHYPRPYELRKPPESEESDGDEDSADN